MQASRLQGSLSVNVAVGEYNLGAAYRKRAIRAQAAKDLDRFMINLELASRHYREAARIDRINNHMESADRSLRKAEEMEQKLQHIRNVRTAAAAAAAASSRG